MAVVQISRIQIRRGQKNTSSGLPQLASGELAWAIDTQELYIGNGAVSEGAPYVGNTKILTEQDNLLELVGTYQFAKNNPAITTGPNANQPILQNLQDVIDQFVTAQNFGVVGDGVADDTAAIQRAIDQLFLNPAAYQAGVGASVDSRTELLFGPGVFKITSTIFLPSYVFITGSGPEHTIFQYDGDDLAFQFVNGESAIGEYTTDGMTQINQPKNAILRDFSISCLSSLASGIELNSVYESKFENITITGSYPYDAIDYTVNGDAGQTGIRLLGGLKNAQNPTIATTEKNLFNKITISNFAVSVRGDSNIAYNNFTNCHFYQAFYGYVFGYGSGAPVNNLITGCSFKYINRHGVLLYDGNGNIVSNCKFEDVGDDGGHNNLNSYPIIEFGTKGNQAVNNSFDRSSTLAISDWASPYKPEVAGVAYFVNNEVQQTSLSTAPNLPIEALRIPVPTSGTYTVTYKYESLAALNSQYQFRKGVFNITIDRTNGNFSFVDDYEILSGPVYADENLIFSGAIVGNDFIVRYLNLNNTGGTLTFVVSALT